MRYAVLILAFLLTACDSTGQTDPIDTESLVLLEPSVDGDLSFSLAHDFGPRSVLSNHTGRTVYLRIPSELVSAERRTANGWEAFPVWYGTSANLPSPVAVPPGTSRTLIRLPFDSPSIDVPVGVYRFQVEVFEDPEWTRPLRDREVISVEFTVTE
jgi:hypothetical protein